MFCIFLSDDSLTARKPIYVLYMLCKVPHQDPSYRGFTSIQKCPAFARDLDCNGEGIDGEDTQYQSLAAQVGHF